MQQLKTSYCKTFNGEHGEIVLDDLMTFCHMREPSCTTNPTELAIREGRRDVITRILECMNMTNIEIAKKIAS